MIRASEIAISSVKTPYRTAIGNSRVLGMDHTHVSFRHKDRDADVWRTTRLSGVEFLRRFLTHVLPRGFHRVRYYGLWHHSKRDLSSRAWLLLILQEPTDTAAPVKIADLLEALGQLTQLDDGHYANDEQIDVDHPSCPHCGSPRTTLLMERPRFGDEKSLVYCCSPGSQVIERREREPGRETEGRRRDRRMRLPPRQTENLPT